EQVAELVEQLCGVVGERRVRNLVGLLNRVRDDRADRLLAVPGTLAPEPLGQRREVEQRLLEAQRKSLLSRLSKCRKPSRRRSSAAAKSPSRRRRCARTPSSRC